MSHISRFTPWTTPRKQLEDIFVARQGLLDDLVDEVRHASQARSRNHTLIVGPRGAGKTHLLAMTYYRIKDLHDDGTRLQVARLPEDPWTIVSYRHLLAAILRSLDETDLPASHHEMEHRLDALYEADGVVIVLIENLDEVFAQIGVDGQRLLRHFLQTSEALFLLATTTTLDRSMTDQVSPFYAFFSTLRLAPLTPVQTHGLVKNLARAREDEELIEALEQPVASRRLRAVQHLAGGQPRLWVAFGQILTPEDVPRMADTLFKSFDDLMPYYEDRLRQLTPQQRLIVHELAAADHPLHVQELARRLDLAQTGVARALGELRELRWVVKVVTPWDELLDGRRSYYELAEPLVRMAFQMKDSVDEPLRVIVDFLSYWFDPKDVAAQRGFADSGDGYALELERAFSGDSTVRVARRLSRLPDSRASDVDLLGRVDDALAALGAGDAEPAMALPTNVRAALEERCQSESLSAIRFEIHEAAMGEMGNVPREPQSSQWIARGEGLVEDAAERPRALSLWSRWLAHGWRLKEAEAVANLIDWKRNPDEAFDARNRLVRAGIAAGRPHLTVPMSERLCSDAKRTWGPDHPRTVAAQVDLAITCYKLGGRENLARAAELSLAVVKADPRGKPADVQELIEEWHQRITDALDNEPPAAQA